MDKPVKGKVLHVIRFRANKNELGHPLSNSMGELETVHTVRKSLLPSMDFIAI